MQSSRTPLLRVVTATKLSVDEFTQKSALGQSLQRLKHDTRFSLAVAFENSAGLCEVYNRALALSGNNEPDALVFCHDDIWMDDIFFVDHVLSGLNEYDVIGITGSQTLRPGQMAWSATTVDCDPSTFIPLANEGVLSGSIGVLDAQGRRVDYFGPAPASCELLDGVFIATKRSTLLNKGIIFDQQFCFHFYDLDFCRQARKAGLSLATWPISITHESLASGYYTKEWREAARLYATKWPS